MSIEAVEFAFTRMAATWGVAWSVSLGGAPIADVKTVWADALGQLTHNDAGKKAIWWALRNLPEKPLNSRQFLALCRQAPSREPPKLEPPKADPGLTLQELAKLVPIRASIASKPPEPPRAWAAKLLERHRRGERLTPTQLAMAQAVGRGYTGSMEA